MKIFQLKKKQVLPITIDQAWEYFSSPNNLMEITPPELKMRVTSEVPQKMYRGAIITYSIKPLLGISMNWVTEITHVIDGQEFIDEQRFGPYKFWHHLHAFKDVSDGVEIFDCIHYGLPGGPLASLVNSFNVRGQLEKIFEYRSQVLTKKFGVIEG